MKTTAHALLLGVLILASCDDRSSVMTPPVGVVVAHGAPFISCDRLYRAEDFGKVDAVVRLSSLSPEATKVEFVDIVLSTLTNLDIRSARASRTSAGVRFAIELTDAGRRQYQDLRQAIGVAPMAYLCDFKFVGVALDLGAASGTAQVDIEIEGKFSELEVNQMVDVFEASVDWNR